MHRRPLTTLALALSLTAVAAGCSSVSDSNAVARVNGVELGQDDLNAKLEVSSGEVLPLEPIRAEIGRWIQSQLPEQTIALPAEKVANIYDRGPAEAGVICINVSVVADEVAAEAAAGALETGTTFVEIFNETNLNDSLAASSGAVPCIPAAQLQLDADTPAFAVASSLSADAPIGTAPLLDDAGNETRWAVIVFRPFADLEQADVDAVTAQINAVSTAADADIFVASRYGTFDPATGEVVGLG